MAIERSTGAFFVEFGSDVLKWIAISSFDVSFSTSDSYKIFNLIANLSRVWFDRVLGKNYVFCGK